MSTDYANITTDNTYGVCEAIPDPSSVGFNYPGDFANAMPGYTGIAVNVSVDPFVHGTWVTPNAYTWGSIDNLTTNPEVDGEAAPLLGVPFSFGAVESSTVENFEMLGNQAVFQAPDVMNWGDVGYANFGGVLGASVASAAYDQPSYQDLAASIVYGV